MSTKAPLNAEMGKVYSAAEIEQPLYDWWEAQGYFQPRIEPEKKPFVISMPPPNVTGALHLGHAITASVEDALIRYHRQKGDPTLWLPGSDHAGIATQNVVERELAKEGLTRQAMGREAFIERVWEWKRIYHQRITDQHRRLGVS
ncbi:MAG: class I tRNA ligase family protein, partial [Chloroflexi bacterium]|nr:class I tRNA ligase family protein [Chloroflexota bacterium]